MDEIPEMTKSGKLTNLLMVIGIYLIAGIVGAYLLFKSDNSLNKDTVEKLSNAVEQIAIASGNMTKAANEQREWYTQLQRDYTLGKNKRDDNYDDLYGKYGYGDQNTTLSLDDIYGRRLQQQTQDQRGSDVRGQQGGNSQAGPVQKSTGSTQGQSH